MKVEILQADTMQKLENLFNNFVEFKTIKVRHIKLFQDGTNGYISYHIFYTGIY